MIDPTDEEFLERQIMKIRQFEREIEDIKQYIQPYDDYDKIDSVVYDKERYLIFKLDLLYKEFENYRKLLIFTNSLDDTAEICYNCKHSKTAGDNYLECSVYNNDAVYERDKCDKFILKKRLKC